jgi:hypothetical protein
VSTRVDVTDPVEAGRWLCAELAKGDTPFRIERGRFYEGDRPLRSSARLRAYLAVSNRYRLVRTTRRGEENAMFPTAAVSAALLTCGGAR